MQDGNVLMIRQSLYNIASNDEYYVSINVEH